MPHKVAHQAMVPTGDGGKDQHPLYGIVKDVLDDPDTFEALPLAQRVTIFAGFIEHLRDVLRRQPQQTAEILHTTRPVVELLINFDAAVLSQRPAGRSESIAASLLRTWLEIAETGLAELVYPDLVDRLLLAVAQPGVEADALYGIVAHFVPVVESRAHPPAASPRATITSQKQFVLELTQAFSTRTLLDNLDIAATSVRAILILGLERLVSQADASWSDEALGELLEGCTNLLSSPPLNRSSLQLGVLVVEHIALRWSNSRTQICSPIILTRIAELLSWLRSIEEDIPAELWDTVVKCLPPLQGEVFQDDDFQEEVKLLASARTYAARVLRATQKPVASMFRRRPKSKKHKDPLFAHVVDMFETSFDQQTMPNLLHAAASKLSELSVEKCFFLLECMAAYACSTHLNSSVSIDGDVTCPVCTTGEAHVPKDEAASAGIDRIIDALITIDQQLAKVEDEEIRNGLRSHHLASLSAVLRHMAYPSDNTSPLLTSLDGRMRALDSHSVQACFVACQLFMYGDDNLESHDRSRALRILVMSSIATLAQHEPTHMLAVQGLFSLGEIADDVDLQDILLHLTQLFASSNLLVSCAAALALKDLAASRNVTTWSLFSPYMRKVSCAVVDREAKRPQTIDAFASLLGISRADFLARNQSYIVPHLVVRAQQKGKVLHLVASQLGKAPSQLIVDNIAAVLGTLLLQQHSRASELTAQLVAIDKSFENTRIDELIRIEPIPLCVEILQGLGDGYVAERARDAALSAVATVIVVAQPATRKTPKEAAQALTKLFLQKNCLGIVGQLGERLSGQRGRKGMLEQVRSIKALAGLIKLLQDGVDIAVPQITASLQHAMQSPDLRLEGLLAWRSLLGELDPIALKPLISHSFCLVRALWPVASILERAELEGLIRFFVDHPDLTAQHVLSLPRLNGLSEDLDKIEREIDRRFRTAKADTVLTSCRALAALCASDNTIIAEQGLHELSRILTENSALAANLIDKDDRLNLLDLLLRLLLDVCTRHPNTILQRLAADCLGLLGAIDPVRHDAARNKARTVVLHNFEDDDAEETVRFVQLLLQDHLVDAYASETTSNAQILLAWSIQELLKFCGFDENVLEGVGQVSSSDGQRRWRHFSSRAQEVMAPMLHSKWEAPQRSRKPPSEGPIYPQCKSYRRWLYLFLQMLLGAATGENAKQIFSVLSRIQREEDIELSNFILPYVFLNVCINCSSTRRQGLQQEIDAVLRGPTERTPDAYATERDRLSCESVFSIVDYLQHWMRSKRMYNLKIVHDRARKLNRHLAPEDEEVRDACISIVESLLSHIPHETMAAAALRCGSYSRSLFYWEQHIRATRVTVQDEKQLEPLYSHLQELYMHIDDPDGIEGVAALILDPTIDQEILIHENAGRWTAATSGYELALQSRPNEIDLQVGLLNALRQNGDFSLLLDKASSMMTRTLNQKIVDLSIESAWYTGRWDKLQSLLANSVDKTFDYQLGVAFQALHNMQSANFAEACSQLKSSATQDLVSSSTESVRACYPALVELHIAHELSQATPGTSSTPGKIACAPLVFADRLAIMGPELMHKRKVLAVRRVMSSLVLRSSPDQKRSESLLWLESARLARKVDQTQAAYQATLQSLHLRGSPLAEVEHAKWWWRRGQQLRAIQLLRKAVESGTLDMYVPDKHVARFSIDSSLSTIGKKPGDALVSKAKLLLSQWNEESENVNTSQQLRDYYSATQGSQLEKPHFLMGRFWLRLLEAETKKPPEQQEEDYLKGDYHRQTIMSYGRAMHFGTKYLFQTLPSYLQLWLDFGEQVRVVHPRVGNANRRSELVNQRVAHLGSVNDKMKTFVNRLPTYLYTLALPQILSRINHPEKSCYANLESIIAKVLIDYPRQTLWSFMGVCNSRDSTRSQRGQTLLARVKQEARKSGRDAIIRHLTDAQTITAQLMNVCNVTVAKNRTSLSLSRDLHFDRTCVPTGLVVPIQSNLTAVLPSSASSQGAVRGHRAFDESQPTIEMFLDEVDVMNSLQKPRKIMARASDGQIYPFLVKPHDDLRKDARLMDFNSVVQKFIRRDPEALKRTLKIRTYAVVALNEEHGLCEWVKHTRAFRDIMLKAYRNRGIAMHYAEIKQRLDEAQASPDPGVNFKQHILARYPPCFHDWFVEKFADPNQWFQARLTYARTLAVMSMVGFVLGLGDRHGENLLLDEAGGDVVHVDFNCLFEKGQTFERPERVPFRLTQNMVDALGVQGVEGAYRRTCELTLRILRTHADSFNTVLESFLHDPVGEFLKKVKKSATGEVEREEARKVLHVIAAKLRGSAGSGPQDKHIPLSIEAQADELIKNAMDNKLLAQMYIGWTAWL